MPVFYKEVNVAETSDMSLVASPLDSTQDDALMDLAYLVQVEGAGPAPTEPIEMAVSFDEHAYDKTEQILVVPQALIESPPEVVVEDFDESVKGAASLVNLHRLAEKWPVRTVRASAVLLTATPTTIQRAAKNKKAAPALTAEVTQIHWRCPKDTIGNELDPTTQRTFVYDGHTFESLLACEIFLRGKNLAVGVRESVKNLSQVMVTRAASNYAQQLVWNHAVAAEIGNAMWARVLGDERMAEYLSTYRGRFSYHYLHHDNTRVVDRDSSWRAEIMLRICDALMRRKQLIDSVDNMDDISDEQYDAMRAEIQTIKPNFDHVHTYRLPDSVYAHRQPSRERPAR